MAFIPTPTNIPWYLRIGLWITRRVGARLLPPRLLAWYPKAAVSSGVMEALIAHDEGAVGVRMLKMVRMAVSFHAACPFCMDLNSSGWETLLTGEELAALQGRVALEAAATLSDRERLAVEYARLISSTPLRFPAEFVARLQANFTPREIVILATTAAQVNYWAWLIQGLGCPV